MLPLWIQRVHRLQKTEKKTISFCEGLQRYRCFCAFVEDSATMSSIPYFESHVSYLVQN